MEIGLPSPYEDEDMRVSGFTMFFIEYFGWGGLLHGKSTKDALNRSFFQKIFETAISLPLMVVDKMFKELGKLKGPETAKMAQKTFRTLLFTEEYINADQENKKKLITRTVLCYAQSMGPDSGLALPIQMLNSTLQ